MTKQVTIETLRRPNDYSFNYENTGVVTLTRTSERVRFWHSPWHRKHDTRNVWVADDGTKWVYMFGQYNELSYEYCAGPCFDTFTRFGY